MGNFHKVYFFKSLTLTMIIVILKSSVQSFNLPITPDVLWSTINVTVKAREKSILFREYCPFIIFHNNDTYANWTSFSQFIFSKHPPTFIDVKQIRTIFNINQNQTATEDMNELSKRMKQMSALNIQTYGDHCINVISILDIKSLYSIFTHSDDQEDKDFLARFFQELLKWSTPIRNRFLIISRLSEIDQDLNPCYRGINYPVRLVPVWELNLFDFFAQAHVIQNGWSWNGELVLKVTKETGRWIWYCDDLTERVILDKECRENNNNKNACMILEEEDSSLYEKYLSRSFCTSKYSPRQ